MLSQPGYELVLTGLALGVTAIVYVSERIRVMKYRKNHEADYARATHLVMSLLSAPEPPSPEDAAYQASAEYRLGLNQLGRLTREAREYAENN